VRVESPSPHPIKHMWDKRADRSRSERNPTAALSTEGCAHRSYLAFSLLLCGSADPWSCLRVCEELAGAEDARRVKVALNCLHHCHHWGVNCRGRYGDAWPAVQNRGCSLLFSAHLAYSDHDLVRRAAKRTVMQPNSLRDRNYIDLWKDTLKFICECTSICWQCRGTNNRRSVSK